MGPKTRIVVALGVICAGLAAALMFRKPSTPTEAPGNAAAEQADAEESRGQPSGLFGRIAAQETHAQPQAATNAPRTHDASFGTNLESEAAPEADSFMASPGYRPDPSTAVPAPPAPPALPPRTHVIRDGDTLTYLAEKYLGSSNRYLEIYAANRNVLRSPDLLPIGAEITIPPTEGFQNTVEPQNEAPAPGRLVPIQPGSLRRQR